MFEKFGEFDSAEEINRKAKELLDAGEEKLLLELAEENGIDKEDAEDYIDGCTDELVTPLMAAVGKVELEMEMLKVKGSLVDGVNVVLQQCVDDKGFCMAVRKKRKYLKYYLALLTKYAFEHKVRVSDEIADITTVVHRGKEKPLQKPLYLSGLGRVEMKKLAREYYLGEVQP